MDGPELVLDSYAVAEDGSGIFLYLSDGRELFASAEGLEIELPGETRILTWESIVSTLCGGPQEGGELEA